MSYIKRDWVASVHDAAIFVAYNGNTTAENIASHPLTLLFF